jgi:hypothetical protein
MLYRQLAKENAAAYLPDVARTLNNLGILYRGTQRLKEAEAAYTECLTNYRQLAEENAAAYRPYVATTLNNLGIFYSATQRLKEAEAAIGESISIRRGLVQANRSAYADDLATSLLNMAVIASNEEDSRRCSLAQEAVEVALSTGLRQTATATQQRVCSFSK